MWGCKEMKIPQLWPLGFWVPSNFLVRPWGFRECTPFSVGHPGGGEYLVVGAEVPGLLLLISWRGIYKWDTGVHHSNVPRDLVPGSCFQFHPLSCAFVPYLMAYWTHPLGYLTGTSNQCHLPLSLLRFLFSSNSKWYQHPLALLSQEPSFFSTSGFSIFPLPSPLRHKFLSL